jgi:aminoglycoside phosphotransferase (APT) family kinase protein
MHPGQLDISTATVRGLVNEQFPAWRGLPVSEFPSQGTVNALFRIGQDYLARFPLQPAKAAEPDATLRLLEKEAAAARELAGRTRFRTPEPVALGEPGPGYPLPWSVQTWLPGTTATDEDPGGSVPFARDLAEFITGLRAIPTHGRRFTGTGRGGDLHRHDPFMQTCLDRSEKLLDVPRLRRLWDGFRDLPREGDDVMSHRDLIPGNVLVADGRLAGVLDVGDSGPADPALDLVSAWHLLETGPRQVLRDALHSGDLEWERGQAWAFQQAMGLVWYYVETNPVMSQLGRRTLERILASTPAA